MTAAWGWAGSVREFLAAPTSTVADALRHHHHQLLGLAAAMSQNVVWDRELSTMRSALGQCVVADPTAAETWSIVFEYELPLEGGRRPDVIVLAGSAIVVLEFKSGSLALAADVDQVRAYARDLADYHLYSHGRSISPVVVYTGAPPATAAMRDGVPIVGVGAVADYVQLAADSGTHSLDEWLRSPYRPLPTLIEAARLIFEHEPLPHVKTALAAGLPDTVEYLGSVVDSAAACGERVLAFVTGVPGAGKTLAGLRLVYERSRTAGRATFLSGNGPLVAVLQHALRSRAFVRDLHAFIRTYGMDKTRIADEQVIVFDEAQRAWDRDYMKIQRDVDRSEPDLLVGIGERLPDWAVLVGLVGEGQEIHSGEEAGMEQWRDAAQPPNATQNWTVHCAPRLAPVFNGVPTHTDDRLDLKVSLRSRRADQIHQWVALLLEGSLTLAARPAALIHNRGFDMYLTREIEDAKKHVRRRYEEEPMKTYGLIASSHAKILPKHGVDNGFMATTKTMNYGTWFNGTRGNPAACTGLAKPVTEFGCQGLELDYPIICWGEDYRWLDGVWQPTPIRRRISQDDPTRLLKNAYRVLLTRGRDGFLIWLPDDRRLDETEVALLAAGVRPLPELAMALSDLA